MTAGQWLIDLSIFLRYRTKLLILLPRGSLPGSFGGRRGSLGSEVRPPTVLGDITLCHKHRRSQSGTLRPQQDLTLIWNIPFVPRGPSSGSAGGQNQESLYCGLKGAARASGLCRHQTLPDSCLLR